MELAKNNSRELHKFISLHIQQENNQNLMREQLGGRFGSSGQCEILTSSTLPTPEGLLSNACRQGLLETMNTRTKTHTCSPRSTARGMISPTQNHGLLRTTCRPCRLSYKEEVQHHATSKAATGMVTAKRHKEDKNIKINTPLKLLELQQEVQTFHWWFLHFKLPTVKYRVVMSNFTMYVPYLGVDHHGDKEALCHQAQQLGPISEF